MNVIVVLVKQPRIAIDLRGFCYVVSPGWKDNMNVRSRNMNRKIYLIAALNFILLILLLLLSNKGLTTGKI